MCSQSESDNGSNIAGETVESLVKPELREEYEQDKAN